MGRKPEKEVTKGLTLEELNEEIQVGVSKAIGYTWLENWNEKGLEGLKPKTNLVSNTAQGMLAE
ncbi:MAG: hypothetical protein ACXQS7_01590 [Candidatus Syntropharchaeia archaeon]